MHRVQAVKSCVRCLSFQLKKLPSIPAHQLPLTSTVQPFATTTLLRKKSKHTVEFKEEESNDERYEPDSSVEDPDGSLRRHVNVAAPRLDSIVKAGFDMSRRAAVDAIQDGKVFVNGRRALKKGLQISTGDTVDLVLGKSVNNENFVDVKRVLLEEISETLAQKTTISIRRWKRLTVDDMSLE